MKPAEQQPGGALLSPEDSRRLPRTLRAWRADQRQAVQSVFHRVAAQWHRDWGIGGPDAAPPATATAEPASAGKNPTGANGAPLVGWRHLPQASGASASPWQPSLQRWADDTAERPSEPVLSTLCLALFGEPAAAGSLASETARRAWADWWQRLAAELPLADEPAPEAPTAEGAPGAWWSGQLQVQLPWCGGRLVLQLEPAQVHALLARHAPQSLQPAALAQPAAAWPAKVNIAAAIGARGLPLRATLGGVELSLRQLQSLRVGDVVPLEHRLDEPAQVESADATVVCQGWLGQQAGHVAVEMVRR